MPTGRRRLASSLRAAEPSSPNEAKALSNNPADNSSRSRPGHRLVGPMTEDETDVYPRTLNIASYASEPATEPILSGSDE